MESLSKNKIKLVRSLQRKKFRDEYGLFVLEGYKSVTEALNHYPELIEFLVSSDDSNMLTENHYFLAESEINEISGLSSGAQWLAVVKKPKIQSINN